MKCHFLIVFLLLFLVVISCKKQEKVLNLLSDDIFLLDAAALFQAENPGFSVQVTLLEKGKNGIFSVARTHDAARFDLIAGEYFPVEPLSSARYAKIELQQNPNFFPFEEDFHQNTKGTGVIYSYDFPVIVGMRENDSLPDVVTLDTFQEVALKESKVENGEEEFAFIPQMTVFPELEFYLLGQDLFSLQEGKYVFSIEGMSRQFQWYHFFNQGIADDACIHRYIRKNEKVDPGFYVHNGIQRYDFRYFSQASALDSSLYRLHFIADNSRLSLRQNVIAISRLSFSKKEAAVFVNFLLSRKMQEFLYHESSSAIQLIAYRSLHFPVISGIVNDKKIDDYASLLKYPNLGDEHQQQRFMNIYNTTMDLIAKDRLKKEDFADFIRKQID